MEVWVVSRKTDVSPETEVIAAFSDLAKYEAWLLNWKWEHRGEFTAERIVLDPTGAL